METKKITTKDYFLIGWHAYFADTVWDFMVLRDRSPWELYYREGPMPLPFFQEMPGTITIGGNRGWVKLNIDGGKLKNYFERYAKPETWEEVSERFLETHDVAMICDGATLSVEFTRPNGKIKELSYDMDSFPEAWHPSYQKAMRLLRYLKRGL